MAETVDLAATARSPSRSDRDMGNKAVTSRISRRTVQLLLQDDKDVEEDI